MGAVIYILDTDTLIYVIRGLKVTDPKNRRQEERKRLAEKILRLCRANQGRGHVIALSAITVAELEFGARRSGNYEKEIRAVRKILSPFETTDFDAVSCAAHYGRIRHDLEEKGQLIGAMDLMIAAHALALGATLVTNNEGHFSRVEGLRIVNWAQSG